MQWPNHTHTQRDTYTIWVIHLVKNIHSPQSKKKKVLFGLKKMSIVAHYDFLRCDSIFMTVKQMLSSILIINGKMFHFQ